MKASKPGLADLKRLRTETAAHIVPPAPPARARTLEPAAPRRAREATDALAASPRRETAPPRPREAEDVDPPEGTPALLDPADRALFRQAMRFVRPLPDTGARAPGPSRRAPDEWLRARRAHAAGDRDPGPAPAPAALPASGVAPAAPLDPDAREFLRPGCGPDLLRGLRRGKWPIEATLDLHGSTLEQADERMDRFLASCLDHGVRCVRIVHGKGYGSRTGVAVLKDAVRTRLARLDAIQAWSQCSEPEGGAGAVVALLRQSPAKDTA